MAGYLTNRGSIRRTSRSGGSFGMMLLAAAAYESADARARDLARAADRRHRRRDRAAIERLESDEGLTGAASARALGLGRGGPRRARRRWLRLTPSLAPGCTRRCASRKASRSTASATSSACTPPRTRSACRLRSARAFAARDCGRGWQRRGRARPAACAGRRTRAERRAPRRPAGGVAAGSPPSAAGTRPGTCCASTS